MGADYDIFTPIMRGIFRKKNWTLVQIGSRGRTRTGNLEVNSFLLHHWATRDYMPNYRFFYLLGQYRK